RGFSGLVPEPLGFLLDNCCPFLLIFPVWITANLVIIESDETFSTFPGSVHIEIKTDGDGLDFA
ncbi:MAG: hypothetical protein WCY83_08830, partial [Bacteroidales bacterium]